MLQGHSEPSLDITSKAKLQCDKAQSKAFCTLFNHRWDGGGGQKTLRDAVGAQIGEAADLQSQDILSAVVSHFEDAGLEASLRGAPLQ